MIPFKLVIDIAHTRLESTVLISPRSEHSQSYNPTAVVGNYFGHHLNRQRDDIIEVSDPTPAQTFT